MNETKEMELQALGVDPLKCQGHADTVQEFFASN